MAEYVFAFDDRIAITNEGTKWGHIHVLSLPNPDVALENVF